MTHILMDQLRTNIHRGFERPARRTLQVATVVALETLLCSKAWKRHFGRARQVSKYRAVVGAKNLSAVMAISTAAFVGAAEST
jgi:hypothetical protein